MSCAHGNIAVGGCTCAYGKCCVALIACKVERAADAAQGSYSQPHSLLNTIYKSTIVTDSQRPNCVLSLPDPALSYRSLLAFYRRNSSSYLPDLVTAAHFEMKPAATCGCCGAHIKSALLRCISTE